MTSSASCTCAINLRTWCFGPAMLLLSVREPGAFTQFTAYAVQDCYVALDSISELIYGISVSIKGLCNLPYVDVGSNWSITSS